MQTQNPNPAKPARPIDLVVIHCSDSPDDRSLFEPDGRGGQLSPAQVIDRWHAERGFARSTYWRGRQEPRLSAIGYHYVIARNGALFNGRHLDEVGAHAAGWNASSIGVCLVGRNTFTPQQYGALEALLKGFYHRFNIPFNDPILKVDARRKGFVVSPGVIGHGKLPGHAKTCPNFDVYDWLMRVTS